MKPEHCIVRSSLRTNRFEIFVILEIFEDTGPDSSLSPNILKTTDMITDYKSESEWGSDK